MCVYVSLLNLQLDRVFCFALKIYTVFCFFLKRCLISSIFSSFYTNLHSGQLGLLNKVSLAFNPLKYLLYKPTYW